MTLYNLLHAIVTSIINVLTSTACSNSVQHWWNQRSQSSRPIHLTVVFPLILRRVLGGSWRLSQMSHDPSELLEAEPSVSLEESEVLASTRRRMVPFQCVVGNFPLPIPLPLPLALVSAFIGGLGTTVDPKELDLQLRSPSSVSRSRSLVAASEPAHRCSSSRWHMCLISSFAFVSRVT